jgi:hypothetical protein
MKYRLQVKNFQSLRDIDLVIEGVTVLYGAKSNIGKTAVVRSLDALLYGNFPKDMVSWDRKSAEIIFTWDNHSIRLTKGEGVNDYEIDGLLYSKFGREIPLEIAKLGFHKFSVQDIEFNAQIRKQFDKAWPMTLNPTDLGKVVGSLVQTEKVYAAIKAALSDGGRVRVKSGQAFTLREDKENELSGLTILDSLSSQIDEISLDDAIALDTQIRKIEQIYAKADRLRERIEICKAAQIQGHFPTEELVRRLSKVVELIDKRATVYAKMALLDLPMFELPTTFEIQRVQRVLSVLGSISSAEKVLKGIDGEIDTLKRTMTANGISVCPTCKGTGVV